MPESSTDTWLERRRATEEAQKHYNAEEWTPCKSDCAYCTDPFYGHPHPHPPQRRISDGMTANDFVKSHRT